MSNDPGFSAITATPVQQPFSMSFSLNEVLQQVLVKLQPLMRNTNAIIRCESLPVVYGSRVQISELFESLVQAICVLPPSGGRLFLYIDCMEEKRRKPVEHTLPGGQRIFQIQFHTNVQVDHEWREAHATLFEGFKNLLKNHNGSFEVNEISGAGCLFCLTVPGKQV
ncbi:MAG TPA: hypothetical protein VFZ78_10500 [Flavisolibacter sp.]